MVDETLSGGGPAASVCPWCSATYAGDPDRCPSCDAALAAETGVDAALPGLTAIDAAAIVRSKTAVSRPRNRLLSWISGEYPEDTPAPGDASALAPPDLAVRREIMRLELEAEVANLQAEADAILAEAAVEGRAPTATAEDAAAATEVADQAEAVAVELDRIDEALEIEGAPVAPAVPAVPADEDQAARA